MENNIADLKIKKQQLEKRIEEAEQAGPIERVEHLKRSLANLDKIIADLEKPKSKPKSKKTKTE